MSASLTFEILLIRCREGYYWGCGLTLRPYLDFAGGRKDPEYLRLREEWMAGVKARNEAFLPDLLAALGVKAEDEAEMVSFLRKDRGAYDDHLTQALRARDWAVHIGLEGDGG